VVDAQLAAFKAKHVSSGSAAVLAASLLEAKCVALLAKVLAGDAISPLESKLLMETSNTGNEVLDAKLVAYRAVTAAAKFDVFKRLQDPTPLNKAELACAQETYDNLGAKIGIAIEENSSKDTKVVGGAKVVGVTTDGSAEHGGIKSGDVIISFNGSVVRTTDDFTNLCAKVKAGEFVSLVAVRHGAEIDLVVRMGAQNVSYDNVM